CRMRVSSPMRWNSAGWSRPAAAAEGRPESQALPKSPALPASAASVCSRTCSNSASSSALSPMCLLALDALDDLVQLLLQRGLGEGFDDVAAGAGLGGAHDVLALGLGRDQQHRQGREVGVGADGFQQLEAVHVWHVDVAHHEVEAAALELLQRGHAVLGLVGVVVAQVLQQVAHDAAHGGEVVDDEKFHGGGVHAASLRCSSMAVMALASSSKWNLAT